jgi:hypothetical protein
MAAAKPIPDGYRNITPYPIVADGAATTTEAPGG